MKHLTQPSKPKLVTPKITDDGISANKLETALLSVKPYFLPPEVVALVISMEERMAKILNTPLLEDSNLPPLTQNQLDRMDAFAIRDEIRRNW